MKPVFVCPRIELFRGYLLVIQLSPEFFYVGRVVFMLTVQEYFHRSQIFLKPAYLNFELQYCLIFGHHIWIIRKRIVKGKVVETSGLTEWLTGNGGVGKTRLR
jgi:hypothetical protein